MTTKLISQFRDFEIFAEKMEGIVEEVKLNHLKDDKGNLFKIEDFDLRDEFGCISPLPLTIKDYSVIWESVQERYNEYLSDCLNPLMPNSMYLDVYWNNVEGNISYYEDLTLWFYFDYEYGIYYETDTEIIEKIHERDNQLA